jgi:hypothetical protein
MFNSVTITSDTENIPHMGFKFFSISIFHEADDKQDYLYVRLPEVLILPTTSAWSALSAQYVTIASRSIITLLLLYEEKLSR